MPIHQSKLLVSNDFEAMNRLIIEKIQAQTGLIGDLANHIIQSGGKRLRPLLVLLSSQACQYQGDDHILLAAMIEFFHTATLLHDDVIDESTLRRGQQTAHGIWGSKASILVGDYLFSLYMQLVAQTGQVPIMVLMSDISNQITLGEIAQLDNRYQDYTNLDDYFTMIRSKTSILFAGATAIGAMIAKMDDSIVQGLYDYGLHLGNAFQLTDDTLDYCSDAKTLGKNVGDDLANGKATLPLLHALQHGTPAQQEKIKLSLSEGTLAHLPDILDAIVSTDAIAYTKTIARQEVDKAVTALEVLPDSVYKTALAEIADCASERDH
ncbi:MAG: polyprenyl synthetase family protein [Gammaproteobacteria bacterium]|nr:polyprenyl synthetase family protein [Gammaproteobacteria bacterium]